jgi:hypothetical protein
MINMVMIGVVNTEDKIRNISLHFISSVQCLPLFDIALTLYIVTELYVSSLY